MLAMKKILLHACLSLLLTFSLVACGHAPKAVKTLRVGFVPAEDVKAKASVYTLDFREAGVPKDQLVFEVPEAEVEWVRHEIPRLMDGVAHLKVPLLAEVGVGPNWDKAH